MRTTILTLIFILTMSITSHTQQWVQTIATPDGAGITEIVITPPGTIIVTTASWSSLAGTLGGVRRSTDEGNTWENPLEGFNGRTLHLGESGVVFASFWPFPLEEAIYRSTNDGVNWTRLHSVNTGDNIFSITSKNNNNSIFIGTRNGVKRSTNTGANWSYVNTGIPANSWVRDLETDTSSGIVVAATTNGVFSTTNDGASWQMATGINPQDTIVKIMFNYPFPDLDDLQETRAVYGADDGALYYSFRKTDYTSLALYALFSDYETTGLVECMLREENKRFRGFSQFSEEGNLNQGGFHLSTDEGEFKMNNNGLPIQTRPSALSCAVNPFKNSGGTSEVNFYMGSFEDAIDGAKVFRLTYLVGIEQTSTEIPSEFKLSQNYPNPFNPETKIKFDIPKQSALGGRDGKMVRLSVYDISGREIAVLVNEELQPGTYEYTFDGAGLSSGMYFYRLQAESFVETKKMLMIK